MMHYLARLLLAVYSLALWRKYRRCPVCLARGCRVKHGHELPMNWRVLT